MSKLKSKRIASPIEKIEKIPGMIEGFALTRRLNTLFDIILEIDAAANKQEVCEILRKDYKWLIECEAFLIAFQNQGHNNYRIISLSSVVDASGLNGNYFFIEEGLLGRVLKNQSPVIFDINESTEYSNSIEGKLNELGIKKFLIVPMKSGKENLGALMFGSSDPHAFDEEDLALAQIFGLQIAVALSHTAFFEDAKKRITQIEIINELSNIFNASLDIDELLRSVLEAIKRDFNYHGSMFFIISDDKSELILKAKTDEHLDLPINEFKIKLGEGIPGWVAKTGETVVVNDVTNDLRFIGLEKYNVKSELAIPIKINDEVTGVIDIRDTKLYAFDETDVIVLQTISEQIASALRKARLYDEIAQFNKKLKELDNLKSEFLGIVSHDFRSPLSSIILAAKFLLKTEEVQSSTKVKEYIQMIVNQGNRLNQLAEDTLSITKIESGQVGISFKVVNVERVLQEAISVVRTTNRHIINYNVDSNVSFIKADHAKLRQVLQNLISNAVKYSPKGGIVNIEVSDFSEVEVMFEIKDQGLGIKPEHVDKLFHKFSRIEEGDSKNIKGSGLGLWICKEIVEAHHGKIKVESEYGSGSKFKFTIKKSND